MTTGIATSLHTDSVAPGDQAAVADAVHAAYVSRQPLLPTGGRTSIEYGGAPTGTSRELDLSGMAQIVDYTPRDMTIVVEPGVRMADLARALAVEGQQLPIDVPRSREATIGGVAATNWTGPRRLGYGTMRDYVIGVHAVDGRGVAFKGGGRVVKNVAGYDFCKLLTGSLGTLGVITQLALKVRPLPEQAATVIALCHELAVAEAILQRLVHLEATPAAIDLLVGDQWGREALPESVGSAAVLAVRIEGTEPEVQWMAEHVQYEFWQGGATGAHRLPTEPAQQLWAHQIEFADRGAAAAHDNAALVVKISVPPSAVVATIGELRALDATCTIQAHAASGIVIARLAKFEAADVNRVLVGQLRPAALERGGSLVVLGGTLEGLTPHIIWGGRTEATVLMERIKEQFDPHGILNPGRFVF